MRTSNRNYAATVPFVEALARLGLRHAAITPGSRNTPLAFAFAANPEVADSSHHDERSAAFFALGMARSTRQPVALVCTSGTAAAEYLPAIIEGRNARIPLIVLTADRPPETRDVGAPQTIDQHGMYGRAVKWSYEAPVPEANPDIVNAFTALAGRAWSAAVDAPMGPVHLNLPFRDPLVPVVVPGDVPDDLPEPVFPSYSPPPPATPAVELVERVFNSLISKKTVIVAGPTNDPDFAAPASDLATRAQIPIIADPLSGLRAGNHPLTNVISTGDWLARRGDLDDALRPELVIRFGATPTSKSLTNWLAANRDIEQVLFEEAGWRDPSASASHLIRSDATRAATVLAARINEPVSPAWVDRWRHAEAAVIESYDLPYPSEPAVVETLNTSLPAGAALWIASSMPIRIMDAFFTPVERDIAMYGNRGANGIDGLISSALGTAVGTNRPTFVYAGDLSTLHDLTALATALRMEVPVTIVLVNNDGGGIFSLLPQADYPEWFEKHLGTPHGLDFAKLAEAFGIEHHLPTTRDSLGDLIATPATSPRIIEIRTDRQQSADLLRSMWKRIARG
ncbi:MAG: 2-succinyl-5-enolpyruvyl-6-hydroxy-3-cyclohexene-1-carboxylic-acid synthase [Acidimicrobiia bacterium]|nr:2-succinyl-5-enolpyruvyl-6-hydroxy-3-cyclohexene-1-carboxylic-acid synthase [Acidimicrobiia bacterium]